MTVTWNPSDKASGITLSNGNLTGLNNSGTTQGLVRATVSIPDSIPVYFEIKADVVPGSGGNFAVGLSNNAQALTNWLGQTANSWGYWNNGNRWNNNSSTGGYSTYTTSDVIMVARNGASIWFGKNGAWNGDPEAGTGAAYTNLTGDLFPGLSPWADTGQGTARFSIAELSYPLPDGFVTVNALLAELAARRLLRLDGKAVEIPEATLAGTWADGALKGLTPTEARALLTLGALALKNTIDSASLISDGVVSLAKLANLAQGTSIGRAAGAGTGVPTALSEAQQAANILTAANAVTWTAPTLLNSWVNFGSGYSNAGYRKDPSTGIVYIRGLIKDGTATNGTVLFNLPSGYRPTGAVMFPQTFSNGSAEAACRIVIAATGDITIGPGVSNTFLSINARFSTL